MKKVFLYILLLVAATLTAKEKKVIRVGYFPNLTHAQALIGREMRWFEEQLGPNVTIQWYVYNAGPSAMEALLVGSIDLTYAGPNPTINAYARTHGKEVRIISGSCSGGSSLVVRRDANITRDGDFRGKKIATPQFGGTQDIACRAWLKSLGFQVTITGGDVQVIPTENAAQLLLLKQKDLEGAWTVEPWVSRLIQEANCSIYLEEKVLWPQTKGQYVTTHLVSSVAFLNEHPKLVKAWVQAHVGLTEWVQKNPEEAKAHFLRAFKGETGFAIRKEILDSAWNRMTFTSDPIPVSLKKYADEAYLLGFLKSDPDLKDIYFLEYLNEVIAEKKQQ